MQKFATDGLLVETQVLLFRKGRIGADPVASCLHAGGIGKETDVAAPNLLKCQMDGAMFDPEKPTSIWISYTMILGPVWAHHSGENEDLV